MKLTARAYASRQDQLTMAALARQFFDDHLHVIDLPYRLSSWGLDNPENAHLWFDENQQLVGWAVVQTPFWSVDLVCSAELEAALHPKILAWVDQHARQVAGGPFGRPAWYFNVFSGQTRRIQDLENAGFVCQADMGEDSWSKVLMRRPAGASATAFQPPEGFTVRPLAGEGEVQGYVDLHQTVFESKNMQTAWRARTLQHPAYRPELDLVVEAPDGQLAAFCLLWFDESLQAGQVEPLGSHPDYRNLGLGRALLAEGLRRLEALGARQIYVETDQYRNPALQLYESFGFEVIQDVLVYRKDYLCA